MLKQMSSFLMVLLITAATHAAEKKAPSVGYDNTPKLPSGWRVHDIARPQPTPVAPGIQLGDAPADGSAGSVYGQTPPMVNACRKPGEWQVYDIVFQSPRFEDGKLVSPAYITVFLNGVLVQHKTEILGPTSHKKLPVVKPHATKLPIKLQNHNNPTRFRNIWIRELELGEQ